MSSLTLVEKVNAPLEVVFELATDLPRSAAYIDAINRIEMLTDGPVDVGTRWRETRTMFGWEATEEFEVTSFDRPTHYTAAGESCGSGFEFTFRFEPDDGGVLVTMQLDCTPKSWLARLMSPLSGLMMGSMRKAIQQDLTDLKRASEAAVRGDSV